MAKIVDPVKAFTVAVEQTRAQLDLVVAHKSDLSSYAKRIQVSADGLNAAMVETITKFNALSLAAEELKKAKGLSPDKAMDHLKAIAAVIHFAEQAGVELVADDVKKITEDVVIDPEAATAKWQTWIKLCESSLYIDCYHCGLGFDATVRGWWDDQQNSYCGLECVAQNHSNSYIPSGPTKWINEGFNGVAIMNGNWSEAAQNMQTNHPSGTMRGCKQIKDNAEWTKRKTWRELAVGLGVFRPTQRLKMVEMMPCNTCGLYFNKYEVGWRMNGTTKRWCSLRCVEHYCAMNSLDTWGQYLKVPNYNSIGVESGAWESIAVGDCGSESWLDYCLSMISIGDLVKPEFINEEVLD